MNIAVFLSQYDVAGKYVGVVEALGKSIALGKHTLIFGGCNEGLMHVIAQTAHDSGAKVVGVIRAPIAHKAYPDADEIFIVKDAYEMNVGLIERADCIVVLAGGIGTLNELTAIVRMKKNAEHDTKTVVVNTGGFYDGLRTQLERMHAEGFLREDVMQSVHFVSTPEEAMGYIEAYGT
ncbi:TIGR00730 family Rossman fold protein [Candidatus Kaiserbacteria bacterium]|nr:TIGR00730 family Rossman fold protein [Candidatus Kaiserbacteria bacterium]